MVLLVAVWLLATLHCGLESVVDLFAVEAQPTGCCNAAGASCATDDCDAVEGALYLSDSSNFRIAAPELIADDSLGDGTALVAAIAASGRSEPGAFERANDWAASWQFVQRAAPFSGAPPPAVG